MGRRGDGVHGVATSFGLSRVGYGASLQQVLASGAVHGVMAPGQSMAWTGTGWTAMTRRRHGGSGGNVMGASRKRWEQAQGRLGLVVWAGGSGMAPVELPTEGPKEEGGREGLAGGPRRKRKKEERGKKKRKENRRKKRRRKKEKKEK